MTLQAVLYSPLSPESYSRPCRDLGRAGIGAELAGLEYRALWNLYWLSDPALDTFISGWGDGPRLNLKMLSACGAALKQKSAGFLIRDMLLTTTPDDFVQHVCLRRAHHAHLVPFKLVGARWLETIRQRAGMYRGLVKETGNIVYAQFGKKPSVTTPGQSAIIMPIAYLKN